MDSNKSMIKKKGILKDNQEIKHIIICGVLNGIILLKILIMYILRTCRIVNILVKYECLSFLSYFHDRSRGRTMEIIDAFVTGTDCRLSTCLEQTHQSILK